MNCKYCGEALKDAQAGRRPRKYCNNAHKQAHYRQRHAVTDPQRDEALSSALARIRELEEELIGIKIDLDLCQERIKGQDKHILRLEDRLDVERRFYEPKAYAFKTWLQKQPHQTDFSRRFLVDGRIEPRNSRGFFEHRLRLYKYSQEEIALFNDLWRLMLLSK